MFISKSQRDTMLKIASIFVIAFTIASCGSAESFPTDIVKQYYNAVENQDLNSAASFFADDAVVKTPSGNVITGIDEIKGRYIPYDLQFMDRVEFLTDFTVSNGKLLWKQEYHDNDGNIFTSECEITVNNGKIVEWVFR